MAFGLNRMPGPAGKPEKGPDSKTVQDVYLGLQSKFMLREYQKAHPELRLDVENPRNNPPEIRNAAAAYFLENGLAEKLRASVNAIYGENELGTDSVELRKTLEDIGVDFH